MQTFALLMALFIKVSLYPHNVLKNTMETAILRHKEKMTTLGRRLLGNLLTIFLPTLLLNVIGHSTNYFKAFFFEAVVSVNLTVMLVCYTLFLLLVCDAR